MIINAQPIDWNYFSEETMNEVMFEEMNHYIKLTHEVDSLVWSKVVQEDIMSSNYSLIKKYHRLPQRSLHNQKWINDNTNELPDSLMNKIISERANPQLLESIYLKEWDIYVGLTYMEILQSVSYPFEFQITYREVAQEFIRNWNSSPAHAGYMNANYRSKILVGVSTYYNRPSRMIFISFVYVS